MCRVRCSDDSASTVSPTPNIKHQRMDLMTQNKASTQLKSGAYTASPGGGRMTSLKELMELEEQRSGLENTLQTLQNRIDTIQRELFTSENRHVRSRLKELRRPRMSNRRRMARGELRAQIIQQLQTAGDGGVNVHAIAARLGMKAVNIHSWFHTALKRFPQIRKSGPSHYHLSSDNVDSSLQAKPTERGTDSIPAASGTRRGEVTRAILNALHKAGATGLSVSDLASHIGSSYRRVHVWLSSTGKKNKLVVRLARGTYKLDENLDLQQVAAGF